MAQSTDRRGTMVQTPWHNVNRKQSKPKAAAERREKIYGEGYGYGNSGQQDANRSPDNRLRQINRKKFTGKVAALPARLRLA